MTVPYERRREAALGTPDLAFGRILRLRDPGVDRARRAPGANPTRARRFLIRAAAMANQVRLIPVAAPRGIIYDRNGVVLVRSRPSFVVGVIPSQVTDVGSRSWRRFRAR